MCEIQTKANTTTPRLKSYIFNVCCLVPVSFQLSITFLIKKNKCLLIKNIIFNKTTDLDPKMPEQIWKQIPSVWLK